MDPVFPLATFAFHGITAAAVAGSLILQIRLLRPPDPAFDASRWKYHRLEGWSELRIIAYNRAPAPLRITGIDVPPRSAARLLRAADCEQDDMGGGTDTGPEFATTPPRRKAAMNAAVAPQGATRFNLATGAHQDAASTAIQIYITDAEARQPLIVHWRWLENDRRGSKKIIVD